MEHLEREGERNSGGGRTFLPKFKISINHLYTHLSLKVQPHTRTVINSRVSLFFSLFLLILKTVRNLFLYLKPIISIHCDQ